MSIIVTGGAGFIGSCVVRTLNDMGYNDIIIVDNIANTNKWLNLRNKCYNSYVHKTVFLRELEDGKYTDATHIIHLGACSSTTEKNFDYLWNNNVSYTMRLWNWCTEKQIGFIYASSAATYGDGGLGFDDESNIDNLLPLNGYGYSKHFFDCWIKKQKKTPEKYVGLKFFNVYGPNEYYKDSMASMVFHGFNQIRKNGSIKLFKSYNSDYENGKQLRDFIYVKDVCKVIKYCIENEIANGIYNVGTGKPQTFLELAEATFRAMKMKPQIEYIEMPEELKEKYQYYTCATTKKIRSGINNRIEWHSLENGITDYVNSYLLKNYKNY